MKESLRHIGDTNRVIALSELFLSNKDSPTIAFNFLDDSETVLLPDGVFLAEFQNVICIRVIESSNVILITEHGYIYHNRLQNRIRLFHSCRLDRANAVDSDDTILIGFRYLPQLH